MLQCLTLISPRKPGLKQYAPNNWFAMHIMRQIVHAFWGVGDGSGAGGVGALPVEHSSQQWRPELGRQLLPRPTTFVALCCELKSCPRLALGPLGAP